MNDTDADATLVAPIKAASPDVSSKPSGSGRQGRAGRFSTVQRMDMVSTVLKSLKESILSGRFGTDGILPPEGELAQSFGVSRTVIREAMRILRAYGLVEVSQGRQPRVKPVDSQAAITSLTTLLQRGGASLLDLIEVRRPLEAEMAALAAVRAQPEQMNRLEATINELSSSPSLEKQVEADWRFHRALAEMAGNPVFGLLLDTLSGLMHESRRQTIAQSGTERAAAGHRRILEALREHNSAAARQAMLDHLRKAKRDLREAKAIPVKEEG